MKHLNWEGKRMDDGKNSRINRRFALIYYTLIVIIIGQIFFYITGKAEEEKVSNGSQTSEENTVNDYYETVDFKEIQQVLDEIFQGKESFNFSSYVKAYLTGEKALSISEMVSELKQRVTLEFGEQNKLFQYLLMIGIVAAIFANFANVFRNAQAAEVGFYISYLLLFSILITSFYSVFNIAEKMLSMLMDFMKALIPTYCVTMTFATGVTTSAAFYQTTLVIIGITEFLLLKVVLPAIQVYFLLELTNHFTKEDFLSRFADLLHSVITWTLKTMFGVIIGFQTIQGLLVPAISQLKNTAISKTISSIPGIGNSANVVIETMIGSGILVKNTVGVVGIIVIVLICIIPIIKILVCMLIYRLGGAVLQPVSERRILGGLQGTAKATGLLLYTGAIGSGLFLLTIVVLTSLTNPYQ